VITTDFPLFLLGKDAKQNQEIFNKETNGVEGGGLKERIVAF